MPRGVVRQGEATGGSVPVDDRAVVYGIGRKGTLVQVIGVEVDGRRFVRVLRGITAGTTYHLPVDELLIPDVQPWILIPADDLPFDRHRRAVMDDPTSPTCPHSLASNKELDYDPDLGCWVHYAPDCRRPQAEHLRNVMRSDGGIFV